MDGIKTNIEKLFDQFATDSLAYNIPRRQSLEYTGGAAATPSNSKKRKLSDAIAGAVEQQQQQQQNNHNNNAANNASTSAAARDANSTNASVISLNDDSHNQTGNHNNSAHSTASASRSLNSTSLLNTSATSAPFEIRRLRADVLEAQLRATQMKNELEQRNVVHQRMEYMYKTKLATLEKQLESSESKLRDSDKHLKILRKRDAASKADTVRAQTALAEQKCAYEEQLGAALRGKHDAEVALRDTQAELQYQVAQQQQRCEELERAAAYRRDEVASLTEQIEQLVARSRRYTETEATAEVQRAQAERLQRRVEELETEVSEFDDS